MRKMVNGVVVQMTPEEIAAREAEEARPMKPRPKPFIERIADLEREVAELRKLVTK